MLNFPDCEFIYRTLADDWLMRPYSTKAQHRDGMDLQCKPVFDFR